MATRAQATFQIDEWDENETLETDGGSKVTHAKVKKTFEGDLTGEGTVEWLMGYDEDGSAAFVGLERVVGELDGKTGTFVVQQVGTFDGQTSKAQLTIVAGSGTGELSSIRGEGSFEAGLGSDGQRDLTLEYDL